MGEIILKFNRVEIKKFISESHNRCRERGLELDLKFSKKIIDDKQLQNRLNRKKDLIVISEPFIEQIYNFVKGSNFFTILTDEEGCILNVIGDETILEEAFSLKMIPGAYMDENSIGTNAMSLVITEKKPIQISGEDHYIKAYHKWTCSAAPIRDSNNETIGVLDLTGYSTLAHSHTLGMVVAAVNSIERMLEIREYNERLETAKIYMDTMLDSIPAGIMTSDLEGNIKTTNKHIQNMFGYEDKQIKQMKARDLFEGWENVIKVIKQKENYLDEDVYVTSRKNVLQYNLSAYPIMDNKQNLNNIVYVFKEIRKVRKLANKIMGRQAVYTFDKIIGNNEEFIKSIDFAQKVADSRSTILLQGESGTGKEVFAQSIHNHSNRRNEAFVAINCGAIPKNLIESEFFGYEEGAFTGAKRSGHPGKFEIADGGTIFLDEIGEMPVDMQTRLLRVIEEGVVSRIGSTKEIVVDVRIIAATNKDLMEEVKIGNFRKDLFYRLNVLPIKLLSLRDRKDDIHLLIEYFMKRISKRINKKQIEITEEYMKELTEYDWPGNIRELENYIELILNTEYIPAIGKKNRSKPIDITIGEYDHDLNLEQVEKQHIDKVLKQCHGNIARAAKALGIG
ncbi:MAG: sigma 54-interacting transcriptional regulator, partial [Alkaliphilus sp.]|nr:sigma 54-interacting transcriptional regulator [Alkaliphilus sp.]